MKIGYQGIPGSYSEAALEHYLRSARSNGLDMPSDISAIGYDNFKTIVTDLVSEELEAAILPVENSTTGLITRTLDLLRYQAVVATHEIYQPIHHTLWGIKGTSMQTITKVYSNPEALSQCASLFDQHPHMMPLPNSDTAQAALFVKEQHDTSLGALSSTRAGKLYGLTAIESNVQSEDQNMTRFFVVKRIMTEKKDMANLVQSWRKTHPNRSRWMLYIETAHKPGALAKILNTIELFDCNMEGLDARPIKDKPFHYGFIIEVDVSNLREETKTFWQTLGYASSYLQLIGCFEPTNMLMDHLAS